MRSVENDSWGGAIPLEELRYFGLPLGRSMEHAFTLFGDRGSLKGLREARELLSNRGLLILDAHLAPLDIIASGVTVSRYLPISTVVLPVSAYDESVRPESRWFFSRLAKIPGVEAYPVFRQRDQEFEGRKEALQQAQEDKREIASNRHFYERALRAARAPHEGVLLTPYNGVHNFGKELTASVHRLMTKWGAAGLCTLSVPDGGISLQHGIELSYQTFVADSVLRFPPDEQERTMLEEFIGQHRRLAQRASAAGFLVPLGR